MRRLRGTWASVLMVPLAACGLAAAENPPAGAVRFTFEARALPEVFDRRGLGRRAEGEAAGRWAVVADLPRPEAAVVRNLQTGAEVRVPLFRGPAGQDPADIALSAEAAAALGIGDRPRPVRVTALRQEPELLAGR